MYMYIYMYIYVYIYIYIHMFKNIVYIHTYTFGLNPSQVSPSLWSRERMERPGESQWQVPFHFLPWASRPRESITSSP